MKRHILIPVVLFTVICAGCGDRDPDNTRSQPTRGELVIGVDESLRPVADAEIAMFSVHYPDARIMPLYLPEKQVMERLLSNEIQTCIICRDLYSEEADYIRDTYSHVPTTFKLADDRIVAVVNNANPLNSLSPDDMKGILSGRIRDWGQVGSSFTDEMPVMVIITGSSGIDRFLSSFAGAVSASSTYALDTTTDVISYVEDNVLAMGIAGGSWFYKKGGGYPDVKILSISRKGEPGEDGAGEIAREVYAVTHEPFTGLGSGFISFMAGQKGQLIIEKAGMTPYKPIEREIDISGSYGDW